MAESESKTRSGIEPLPGLFGLKPTGVPAISGAGEMINRLGLSLEQARNDYVRGRYDVVTSTLRQALLEVRPTADETAVLTAADHDAARMVASMWALLARAASQSEATSPGVAEAALQAAMLFARLRDSQVPLSGDELIDVSIAHYLAGRFDDAFDAMAAARAAGASSPEMSLYEGVLNHNHGRHDAAIRALGEALDVTGPRLALLRLETLAASLESLGQRDEAARLYLEVADEHYKAARFSEALPLIEHLLKMTPSDAGALLAKAEVLRLLDRPEDALSALAEVLRLDPQNALGLAVQGFMLHGLKRLSEAAESMRRALAQYPDNVAWLAMLGNILRELNQFAEARVTLTRAIELDPDNAFALARRGDVLRSLNEPKAALDDLDKALRLLPDDLWTRARRAEVLRMLGNLKEALSEFELVLKEWPDDVWSLESQGDAFWRNGQFKEAEVVLRRTLELSPDNLFAKTTLGHTLSNQGRDHEAIVLFDDVLKGDPKNVSALEGASYALLRLDDFDRGLKVVQEYLEVQPESAWGQGIRGAMLYSVGRYAEGLEQLRSSTQLDGDIDWAQNCYALCSIWLAEGKAQADAEPLLELARERAAVAVRLEPEGTTWRVNLGEALWRSGSGRRAEAIEQFEKVLNAVRAKDTPDYYEALDGGWAAFRLAFGSQAESSALLTEAERCSVEALKQKRDRPSSSEAIEAKFNLALAVLCSGRAALALREYAYAVGVAGENQLSLQRGFIGRAKSHLERTIQEWPGSTGLRHADKAVSLLDEAYTKALSGGDGKASAAVDDLSTV